MERFGMFAMRSLTKLLCAVSLLALSSSIYAEEAKKPGPNDTVSYYKDIRPLFQAHCQACHQPAKASGGYVLTDFSKLIDSGDSGEQAVVPGKPAESELIHQITPKDGT